MLGQGLFEAAPGNSRHAQIAGHGAGKKSRQPKDLTPQPGQWHIEDKKPGNTQVERCQWLMQGIQG